MSAVVELAAGEYDVAEPGGADAESLGTEGGVTRYRIEPGSWSFESAV